MSNPNININNMIVPIDQYDDTVVLCFYGYLYDYNHIITINQDTKDIIIYKDIKDHMFYDEDLDLYVFHLKVQSPGTYNIFATTDSADKMSIGTKVVVIMDSRKELYKNLIEQMITSAEAKDLYRSYLNELSTNSNLISGIYHTYDKIDIKTDKDKKINTALLLNKILQFYNYRLTRFTVMSDTININMFDKSFIMPNEVNSVVCVPMYKSELAPEIYKNTFNRKKTILRTQPNTLYVLKFLDNNRHVIGLYYYFEPTLDLLNIFKQDAIANNEKYARALEKSIQYPSSYLSFSDEEIMYLATIDSLEMDIPIFKAPTLTIDGNTVFVTVNSTDLMIATTKEYYLNILETELHFDLSSRRRILISSTSFSFTPSRYSMLNESFLYWIEDNDGHIVSNVKVLHLDPGENFDNAQDRTNDINERIRQLKLYNYKMHLMPYLANHYAEANTVLQDAFKCCESDQTTETPEIVDTILTSIMIPQYNKIVPSAIRCMHEDRTIYGSYLAEFFDGILTFKHKSNTVVIPPRENTLCIFESYSIYDEQPTIEYRMAQQFTATEYRFNKGQYCVVKALDLKTFKLSGFLFLDLSKNDLIPRYHKYLVDAEVRN